MKIKEDFRAAVGYYQDGDLGKARKICNDILSAEPENIDVIQLLAVLHYQLREYDIAAGYIRRVLQFTPDDFYAHFLSGNILHEQGKLEEAMTSLQRAAELNPSLADVHYNLAIIFEKMERFAEALASYRKALDLDPDLADVNNNVGNLLLKMKRGNEAIPYLRTALRLDPDYVLALNNLGIALKEKKNFHEALGCLQKAVRLDPSLPDAHCNLAIVLKEQGRIDEAAEHLQEALRLNPSLADAHYNLAIVLKEQGRIDDAEEHLQEALRLNPSFADAYCNLAIIFEESGRLEKALECYEKALQISPNDAEIHWNMSFALLSSGDFRRGWREYEWRCAVQDFNLRTFPLPRWDGSSLRGKSLLIYAEQGIGEELMFSSCFPEVISRAGLCVIECDERIAPLFSRSFPGATVIGRVKGNDHGRSELPRLDMRISIGSLPFFFRPDLSSFPEREAYLVPDPSKSAVWGNRLSALGRELKVGISWRGGGKVSEKRLRSTVLEQWEKVFSVPGVRFINLQYGDCAAELKEARDKIGIPIHDWEDADPLKDLDNFAAEVSALDLVISVDNATVHMAGALGVPVWALLPFACDWRWMRDFEDTPWYKTVRLIRQSRPADWVGVFDHVAADLSMRVSNGVAPESRSSYRNSLKTETSHRPFPPLPSTRTYRCAVITPVGPGHGDLYEECRASIENSFAAGRGNFSEFIPLRIADPDGRLGRSKARNLGIRQAVEHDVEWIFFLDADDVMAPSAFQYASPYLEEYDGVWGSIWAIEQGEKTARERREQLPFLYGLDDIIHGDPFLTLQMGHFVRTSAAQTVLFDESLDTGEDFDYYLRVWERYRCIKIPLPFFYNRRGLHSQGPRSATGHEWCERVESIIKKRYPHGIHNSKIK